MVPRSQRQKQLDVKMLTCTVIVQEFDFELRNRFSALADTSVESDHEITNKCDTIKKTYFEVATKVLGYKKKNHKERVTPGTWKKNEERKQLKNQDAEYQITKAPATGPRSLPRQRQGSQKECQE